MISFLPSFRNDGCFLEERWSKLPWGFPVSNSFFALCPHSSNTVFFSLRIKLINLHRNNEGTGEHFHTGKSNILHMYQRTAEVLKVIETSHFLYFAIIVEMGNKPVLGVGENIRMYGRDFLGCID